MAEIRKLKNNDCFKSLETGEIVLCKNKTLQSGTLVVFDDNYIIKEDCVSSYTIKRGAVAIRCGEFIDGSYVYQLSSGDYIAMSFQQNGNGPQNLPQNVEKDFSYKNIDIHQKQKRTSAIVFCLLFLFCIMLFAFCSIGLVSSKTDADGFGFFLGISICFWGLMLCVIKCCCDFGDYRTYREMKRSYYENLEAFRLFNKGEEIC